MIFLVFGIIATRRASAGLGHLVTTRTMPSAGAAVRLVTTGVGYLIIICAELGLLDVSIDHLLVGAGLAGIVLGIAAQQSLGNVFASVVLLLAKPFTVGERIRIRSGTLGGIFDATVMGVSLTYVTVRHRRRHPQDPQLRHAGDRRRPDRRPPGAAPRISLRRNVGDR